jgi:hypothetical protein
VKLKNIKNMKREVLESAVNQFSTANSTMCSAIEEYVKELADNGNKVVLFKSVIDCATCDPLVQAIYDRMDDCTYIVSDQEDYISLDDLTGNELFEICNHLMAGNYEVVDSEIKPI